ncbi:MAG TPA: ATP-binding cassette domain-containing protein [Ktedonobacterales bacterium]|nr:ATP-binding cassette domain-containing protein [Ktedonobacterales bacterium]
MSPAAPDDILIAIEGVSFAYPGRVTAMPLALTGISLRIRHGEYVALVGHNGSGKSTLARLLNGLLLPTVGRVLVAGLDTRQPGARRRIRERVGMIFSDPDTQIVATLVEDDVAWGLAARGWPRAKIAERVDAALAAVGLAALRGRPPHDLSGGQLQRLAIAGVLALAPECIVADEPTALLDPLARAEMVALLADLNRTRGLTVVHVTHLLEETAHADRVVVLEGGRIALEGTPRAVLRDLDRLRSLRLVVPELAELGERLRALGVDVPADALSPEAMAGALARAEEAAR